MTLLFCSFRLVIVISFFCSIKLLMPSVHSILPILCSQAEEAREKKREMLKKKRQKSRESQHNKNRNLEDIVTDAMKRQQEYERKVSTSGDVKLK